MTFNDPDNKLAAAFANLDAGNLKDEIKESAEQAKALEQNPFAIRQAIVDDGLILESIEREAFPGMLPVTRISRDLLRENGLYLAAVRDWTNEERELGPRLAVATKTELEDESFSARLKRNFDKFVLDRVTRPRLPSDYIAGFIGLWFVLDEAHVVIIGLRETERRQGIGEQLLISAIEQASDRGSRVVTLEVRKSNTPAIELYKKYGFQEVGLRRRYYSDNGEDALIMTTSPIVNEDFRSQFEQLVKSHAGRYGWVRRPGYGGPSEEISED